LPYVPQTLAVRIGWRFLYGAFTVLAVVFFRERFTREAPFPKTGPVLVLGNHVSFWDPFWLAWGVWRPVRFMASANLFRIPGLSWLLRAMGSFPKERFVKDKDSMRNLVRVYEDGLIVCLFPEGLRTWDGRQADVGEGIGRLIQRLGARVVYCRNLTGHLQHPRWARYPRWVAVQLEYSAPVTYAEELSVAQITADVRLRLSIDHEPDHIRGWLLGFRLAHGLPDYVWACPACEGLGTLEVDPRKGDRVACGECGSAWTVNILGRLKPEGAASATTVAQAADAAKAAVGLPPARDRERLEAEGVALEVAGAEVLAIRGKGELTSVAAGTLVLTSTGLRIRGETGWELSFEQMKVCFVDVGNQLQLRTLDALLVLRPGEQSPLMWEYFVETWRRAAAG
jgi:1-acyl-sn-glycerol-3-phosphate acyltransferase